MLEELNDLIKPDPESQAKFKAFKESFLSDNKTLAVQALKRARITALTLGSATVISILFLVYAFKVQTEAQYQEVNFESQIHQLESKLEDCEGRLDE